MRITLTTILTALLLLAASTSLVADVAPKLMNYQALVTDALGAPLDCQCSIVFTIYGSKTGDDILWQETHTSSITAGQLNAVFGEGDIPTPIDEAVFSSSEAWLGITVEGDPELTPRSRLVAVPYSQRVNTVDLAKGGAISGTVQIDPPALKSGDALEASLIVRGSAGDSVVLSPADDVAFYATNDAGDVALVAMAGAQGGTFQVNANASAAFASSPRFVSIQPAVSIAFQATGDNGDDLIMMTTPPEGGTIEVNASNQLKDPDAVTRSIQIAPAQNIVIQATEENGDATVALTTNPNGGAFRVSSSDAAKSLTGSVLISPADNVALRASDGNGNVMLEAVATAAGTSIIINEVSKDGFASTPKLEINNQGLSFFTANGIDTAFCVDVSGNIYTKGNVIAGQNFAKKSDRLEGAWATVLGFNNDAPGDSAAIGGGYSNQALSRNSTVSGGVGNIAGAPGKAATYGWETIGGGSGNSASGQLSTVAGGGGNQAIEEWTTIAGGLNNTASGTRSTILGGQSNETTGFASTVAGGYNCAAEGAYAATVGGNNNSAIEAADFVGGGGENTASGGNSAVVGGVYGESSGPFSIVTGGQYNKARGQFSTVGGGGGWSDVDSNVASGHFSVVPGGQANRASASHTLAAGTRANADHEGSLVWADANAFEFHSSANNEFAARSIGGVRFVTAIDGSGAATAGVSVAPGGGSWSALCDVNLKDNIEKVDVQDLLDKLATIDISMWNYRAQDESIRHIGPMAQDFYEAFGVGEDERRITTIDADGIALAAIQALNAELNRKTDELAAQGSEIEELKAQLAKIQLLLDKIMTNDETIQ